MQHPALVMLLACAAYARAASYTTYIGDSFTCQVSAIATDANSNTYITGSRAVVSTSLNPLTDIFVSKLDPAGKLTPIATFSGKGLDQANGMAVDPSGNIYVVGTTTSTDFPLRHPLQGTPSSGTTGFLTKLTSGGTVIYSTYLGGTKGNSLLNSVAADADGNAYVTGMTQASDYPQTPGLPAGAVYPALAGGAISGAFFAKIDPAGSQVVYGGALSTQEHDCGEGSTCFLGPVYTEGTSIAVDPDGNAYVAGNAGGGGLPTTTGALLMRGIGAFVAKINAAGSGLTYLTYVGSANYIPGLAPSSNSGNLVYAIAADAGGNAYISGTTSDPAFPATSSAFQTTLAGSPGNPFSGPSANAFVAKLNPAGSSMVWATFLGGNGPDQAHAIAPDPAGNVWVSGTSQSVNFTRPPGSPVGNEFLVELNASGSALTYSALFPNNTVAAALAVDAGGVVHSGGATGLISAFPENSPPGQSTNPWVFGLANSAGGALGGRVAPGELISLYGLHLGPATPVAGVFNAAGLLGTTLGGVTVTINGIPAPLLYVSDGQINAVAPVELTVGSAVTLQVSVNGVPLPDFRTFVDGAAPQVFRSADGFAAAVNQDGIFNSKTNPAPAGSYVSVWATGTGYFPASDGQVATAADPFCNLTGSCEVLDEGGKPVDVAYVGAGPGTVNGVIQINFKITSGVSYYDLNVNGVSSDPFGVYVTP
jgi:uncharacterized protein (TIGR03437 family)